MADNTGKWVWFELIVPNIDKAVAFVGETLGWKREDMAMGPGVTYTMLKSDEKNQAGVTQPKMDGVPAHWAGYLAVADADAAAKSVAEHGGKVIVAPFDIPTIGRAALVADPNGATFFAFAGDGDGSGNTTAVLWMEMVVADAEAACDFYCAALGYEKGSMPLPSGEGSYYFLKMGDKQMGGLMNPPAGWKAPPMWMPYVGVEDTDATMKRALSNGGACIVDLMDMPNVGRFGVFADDQGAALGIMTPAARKG